MGEIMPWIWLGVIIFTVVYEFLTYDLESIWFTVGAVVALLLSFFEKIFEPWVQLLVFGGVSVIMLITLRKWTRKIVSSEFIPTNADSLIGKEITIGNVSSKNQAEAKVNGVTWSIEEEHKAKLEEGQTVVIKRIEGNKLIVEKEEQK
ncbi:MAG: NfeD family protein [Erysipelotrichaceae bacterium]|nr:NfeD family protein [Erysipelotrichaceae bacterium]